MTKHKGHIVHISSQKDGKIYGTLSKNDKGEYIEKSENLIADACSSIYMKKDAYGFGFLGIGLFGMLLIQALFIGLFSYFWYGKDIQLTLGFIGYLVTLDILSYTMFIPILGSVIGFIEFFIWDNLLLNFFELPSDALTLTIKILFLISILIGNIIVTIIAIYWKMNKEEIMEKYRKDISKLFEINGDGISSLRKYDKTMMKLLLWIGLFTGIVLLLIPIISMIINGVYVLDTIELTILIIGIALIVSCSIIMIWKRNKSKTTKIIKEKDDGKSRQILEKVKDFLVSKNMKYILGICFIALLIFSLLCFFAVIPPTQYLIDIYGDSAELVLGAILLGSDMALLILLLLVIWKSKVIK